MAFNLQTFQTRTLTALVFVAVMLTGLLWSQWSFLVLFSVIHFGCWTEYRKLVGLIDPAYQSIGSLRSMSVMLAGWGFMLWMTGTDYRIGSGLLSAIGFWIGLVSALFFIAGELVFTKKFVFRETMHSVFGFVYISLSWGLLMDLWTFSQSVFGNDGRILPLLLIASIWINDTMAYIVGSFIGKTPFSPISPKKTWEGTIGGAILAVAIVTLAGRYAFMFPVKPLLLISITAAIAGTAGDLLESKLKRLAGVKDSGSILPGHGGFLDRFDSLLVATTLVWIVFRLF